MREETQRKPAPSIQRPARLRPSLRRRLVRLMVIVGVWILSATFLGREVNTLVDPRQRCAAMSRVEPAQLVIRVCREEFERTNDPKTGALLAHALRKGKFFDEAKLVATPLLSTVARPDALLVLGEIAYHQDDFEYAIRVLQEARILHGFLRERLELARDVSVLALIRSERTEYVEALQLAHECIALTQKYDKIQERHCHVAAARTLISLGYFSTAKEEIKQATALAADLPESDEARIEIDYERGNLAQESGEPKTAVEIFGRVLRNSKRSPNVARTVITEENLAYSLAELGRTHEAQEHLDKATELDRDNRQTAQRTWTAAQIAYKNDELPRATELVAAYFDQLDTEDDIDRDDRIDVASLGAEIALASGDLSGAETWARRGVCEAERIRSGQSALELRATILTKRRRPYELLFVALARQNQVARAALAFDHWQGRSVQDALARPRLREPRDHQEIARQFTRLGEWVRAALNAPFASNADRQSVLRTMLEVDLLALIVANGEVWRLTANHGPPRLSLVGDYEEIKDRVSKFSSGRPDAADALGLGSLLIPDELFRKTGDVLNVVIDGQLAELPVAALRHGNTPLVERRPHVRLMRLPETRCASGARSDRATVLGDPLGTLESARREAEQVANLLHAASKTGAAAKKADLLAAGNDAVLHVAARRARTDDGPALELADGNVSALEISASKAPSLVVLSSCDATTANPDEVELASSLVAAFLAAGSQHVVATLISVEDTEASKVSTGFYRARGVADPARALQTAQREFLRTDNTAWPHFTVFGPDVCLEVPPVQP